MVVIDIYIILTYDISVDENGAKVLRNTFKTCKKYLHHVQFSVFEGEISPSQFMSLSIELKKWIRPECDSVIIFQTREEKWLKKNFIGRKDDATTNIL